MAIGFLQCRYIYSLLLQPISLQLMSFYAFTTMPLDLVYFFTATSVERKPSKHFRKRQGCATEAMVIATSVDVDCPCAHRSPLCGRSFANAEKPGHTHSKGRAPLRSRGDEASQTLSLAQRQLRWQVRFWERPQAGYRGLSAGAAFWSARSSQERVDGTSLEHLRCQNSSPLNRPGSLGQLNFPHS